MSPNPMVYPRARLVMARILSAAFPNWTPEQSVSNAEQLILAMHKHGFQMGPLASFGPHDTSAGSRDAFDNFGEVLTLLEERQPWNPPELR